MSSQLISVQVNLVNKNEVADTLKDVGLDIKIHISML